MEVETEVNASYDQMLILERYERVIAYLYPIAQSIPRRHGIAKAMFTQALLGQVQLIVEAGKSNQISRLYIADAGLSQLRFWLRFVASEPVRSMTGHQLQAAQALIAEVGGMLGSWIGKLKRRGPNGN